MKMYMRLLTLPALLLVSIMSPFSPYATAGAAAAPSPPLETARHLARHLSGLQSLSFSFNQRTSGQMSGRPRQASGRAYFVKTEGEAKMRWNYHAPDTQVIISDGTTLKMYFENLNQMIIAPAETLQQDVTYSFFTGTSSFENDFAVFNGSATNNEGSAPVGYESITLVPKKAPTQIKDIQIWVTDTLEIKRIEIRDTFDTVTLLTISNMEENSLLQDGERPAPDFFNFTPPEGTEIIHQ